MRRFSDDADGTPPMAGSRPYRRYSSCRSRSSCPPRPSRSGTKIHAVNNWANTRVSRRVFQGISLLLSRILPYLRSSRCSPRRSSPRGPRGSSRRSARSAGRRSSHRCPQCGSHCGAASRRHPRQAGGGTR